MVGEPVGLQPEAPGDAGQHGLADAGQLADVGEDDVAELGRPPGEEVGPVEGRPVADPWVIGAELGAEVDALLQVGHAGGELAAHGEPPPPRPPAPGHGDLGLLLLGQVEEGPGQLVEPGRQLRVEAVADDVEEADLPTGGVELLGDGTGVARTGHEGTDVDDGDVTHGGAA